MTHVFTATTQIAGKPTNFSSIFRNSVQEFKLPVQPRSAFKYFYQINAHKIRSEYSANVDGSRRVSSSKLRSEDPAFIQSFDRQRKPTTSTKMKHQYQSYATHCWHRLPNADRQPYIQQEQADKQRYQRELAALGIPIRPRSAYMFFAKEQMSAVYEQMTSAATVTAPISNSDDSVEDSDPRSSNSAEGGPSPISRDPSKLTGILAQKWNELEPISKKKYTEMAERDRRRYDTEMAQAPAHIREFLRFERSRKLNKDWNSLEKAAVRPKPMLRPKTLSTGNRTPTPIPSRQEKKMVRTEFGKPVYPPGPFLLFCAEYRRQKLKNCDPGRRKTLNNRDLAQESSAIWKTLTPDARQVYTDEFQASLGHYRQKMTAWRERMRQEGFEELAKL